MPKLYAFFGPKLAGTFSATAAFEYSSNPGDTPVSLSLPFDGAAPAWLATPPGSATANSAYAYLDGLLPDRPEVRERWARSRNLPNTDPITLLGAYGEDVAGALTLTTQPDLPQRQPEPLIEATEDDIAARIAALNREPTSWLDPRAHPRMSLAGAQGKFTLAKIGDRWFWPTFEQPSTHILKPPAKEHKNLDLFEHLSLQLAQTVGVPASRSEVLEFCGQSTIVVERWDRHKGIRLHAEDLNQALGNFTDRKYDVEVAGAPQIARLLNKYGQADAFVKQLAFNVALGNGDAHAKNYSVLLAGGHPVLAPLYDAVPTFFWPRYQGPFSMPIGVAHHPNDLTRANWNFFATQAGLAADQVWEQASTVIQGVINNFEPLFAAGGVDQNRLTMINKHTRVLQRALGAKP